ncbi:MAG TPA: fused MFS/spermidine synthase, partial [Spirochaetia bacterium]|nr:fused MFS/spermidine synthase [Spirochaetia bacterium]
MSKSVPSSFLYAYVSVTGASVMALELAASRFLAPFFGTSMIVWANIIGLILLSLSLGYWVGGHLADHKPDIRVLMVLSLASGTWSSLVPVWGRLIFQHLTNGMMNTPLWTIILSFIAILLVFAPPVFLLAMVSPFALRLISAEPQHMGKVAGGLYAFSTLGSLIGTFGTAFGTIPFWGTQETIFFWSGTLILISAWGLRQYRLRYLAFILLLLPVVLYGWLGSSLKPGINVLWSKDTLYQFVQVLKFPDQSIALVYNEGGAFQSLAHPNDELSTNDYFDDYLLLPYLVNEPQNVLVLGSAGGTIPHLLAKYDQQSFPGLSVTGVEIDPAVIPLDYQFFGLKKQEATLVNQDARVFVNQTHKQFSIIIVDAYTQQIYIPFHLSTEEFFQTLQNRLQPGGLIAMNVNATTPASKLLQSMVKTVGAVFPYTYIAKSNGEYNYVLLGSQQPLDFGRFAKIKADNPL